MKIYSKFFLLLFCNILILVYSTKKFNLNIEYLLSDDKEILELELYNTPKNPIYDFGEDIFYTGKIESIENFPVSKLVNYNETQFNEEKKKRKEEKEYYYGKRRKENEKYIENEEEKEKEKEKKKENETPIKNEERNIKNRMDNFFDEDFFEDPFFTFFYNGYNPYENRLRYKNNNKEKNKNKNNNNNNYNDEHGIYNNDDNNDNYNNKYNDYYYNNNNNNKYKKEDNYYNQYNNQYNQYKNQYNNQYNNNYNNNNNIQVIQQINDGRGNTIKIIKIPKANTYQNNNNYNNNNYGNNDNELYNTQNNNYNNDYNYNRDPFSIFDDFGFSFGIDNPLKYMESTLNNLYGIRILSENNNKKIYSKLFSNQKHNLLFIPNNLYFDYIKYLPKSSILLIPKQYIKKLINYEDYYIFTVEENLALITTLSKTSSNHHQVKLGQNFTNTNSIFISITIVCFICLISSIIYTVLLKNSESYNILPVQQLSSKFAMFLCLLNLLVYFSFICSYQDTDNYYTIIKYLCLFLYSLYKSIFLSLLTLLLNGWMTLAFIGWSEKMSITIPFLFYELISSISFEIIGFYNILQYNKLQLYYFRNIFESIFIICMGIISLYRYYIPLKHKCKYLSLISSDFLPAYKLKKKKMLSYIIFSFVYGFISIYSNYYESDIIFKYIQNDVLHNIKQVLFESIFNFIFVIILLPMELPYLFTEETDLLSFEYFFTNLNEQKDILDINDNNINEIKKEAEDNENVPIIVVNPFYRAQDGFDELHTGKISVG